jgi:hypothetical protein
LVWIPELEHAEEYLPCAGQPDRLRITNPPSEDVLVDSGDFIEPDE